MSNNDDPCPTCGNEVKEEEAYYKCTMCEWWNLKQDDDSDTLNVLAVYVVGHDAFPIAVFRYPEHAEEWARDNYFGQWLTKVIKIPRTPLMTDEEAKKAREAAAEMLASFKKLPEAE